MEVAEARAQLQRALNLSHPVQTARYLTVAAAACLNHGLQKSPPGSGRLLVLLPVAYAQVAEHVKANCPEVSNLLLKLQGKTASKYFAIRKAHVSEPLMVALDVHVMITPPQRQHVSHVLANLRLAPFVQDSKVEDPRPNDIKTATSPSATQLAPSHSTGNTQMSQLPPAPRPNSASAVLTVQRPAPEPAASYSQSSPDAAGARVQLQDAILKSHGSHTARWLTETAAACLQHGLSSSPSTGVQLHPIKCTLVTTHIREVLPGADVMAKLQSTTGLKYFRLFWASQQPDTVLLRLREIILVPGQPTALANLLRSIEVVDRPILAPVNGHTPPSLPASMQPASSMNTAKAAPPTQRFSVADAMSHLKGAIAGSHPPTAKYMVETAAACLDHGLQAVGTSFHIRPVSWLLVADTVSHHCPHAELLEKLCGRTGQKYFQLLGNTDDGLPEFILADIHALISPRQSPAVAHILSQMQVKSQPNQTGSDPALGPAAHHNLPVVSNMSSAQASKAVSDSKQPNLASAAGPKPDSGKGAGTSWVDPPPGFAPLPSREGPDADKPTQPVLAPSSHASASEAASSKAMQALLSACKQLPPPIAKDSSSAQNKPAAPSVLQTKPVTVSTNGRTDVVAANKVLPGNPLSEKTSGAANAATSNGVVNDVRSKESGGSRSSSSSASGMTEAIQARSAASTELSASSNADTVPAKQDTVPPKQHTVHGPFCIDCIAQPGKCHRHPLVPPSASATPRDVEVEVASLEAAAGSSECSSQDHVMLDFNNPVAVLCFPSDTADGLGEVQLHSEKETQMLDLKQSPPEGSLAKLKALLEDGDIVKVFHDCQQHVEQLYRHHAIKVQNIFDVRVAQAVLGHVQCLMGNQHAPQQWRFDELLNIHDVRQAVSADEQHGAGKSVAAQDAASLLQLWKVYLSRLGAVGTSVVFRLSQALSDGTHVGTSSPLTLSLQHQGQPVNKDLVMTFPSDGSFVPIFKSPDNAIMESDPEAGTSASESTDAESVAAGTESEVQALLDVLPEAVQDSIIQLVKEKQSTSHEAGLQDARFATKSSMFDMLLEIIVDKGRPWRIVFRDETTAELSAAVSIDDAVTAFGALSGDAACHPFEDDNRAGVDGTLHSIVAIRDRGAGRNFIGLTFRIGRHVPGAANIILDVLAQMQQKHNDSPEHVALLIVGKPQTGKTTLLRDIASIMADKFKQRMVVVDTHGELGGNGSVPHHTLKNTRRLSVTSLSKQHEVLLEAVHNHKPGVLVVDEINSVQDAQVVQSIVARGIRVIAGASACTSLASLLTNPDLTSLVRVGTSIASQAGRAGPPAFGSVLEVLGHGKCRFHPDAGASINSLLAGRSPDAELRIQKHGKLIVRFEQGSAMHEVGNSNEAEWLRNLVSGATMNSKL